VKNGVAIDLVRLQKTRRSLVVAPQKRLKTKHIT